VLLLATGLASGACGLLLLGGELLGLLGGVALGLLPPLQLARKERESVDRHRVERLDAPPLTQLLD
jgi:hypothetical protein